MSQDQLGGWRRSAGGTAPRNWKNPEYVKGKKELFPEQITTVSSLITTGKSVLILSIPNLEQDLFFKLHTCY